MATFNPVPNNSMMSGNNMMELLKFKLITDVGLNSGGNNSLWGMLLTFLVMTLFDSLSKHMMTFLADSNTYIQEKWYNKPKNYTLDDFKYKLAITNLKYKNLIYYATSRKEAINFKYGTVLGKASIKDQYNVTDIDPVLNYVHLDLVTTVIPLKKVKFNQYIYYGYFLCPMVKDWYHYLLSNSSMDDIVAYIKELDSLYGVKVAKQIYYYTNTSLDKNQKIFRTNKNFDNLFFEQKEALLQVLEQFRNNQWYIDRGVAHHLGLLLSGEPGCGKTSLIKALAGYYGKNIYNVDLSLVTTKAQFTDIIGNNFESIVIFEDFDRLPCVVDMMNNDSYSHGTSSLSTQPDDAQKQVIDKLFDVYLKAEKIEDKEKAFNVFKKECASSVQQNDKLDLAHILNILDGVIEYPGRIIIFTCNHPERLCKALLRPGRVDFIIEFKKANSKVITDIIKHFYQLDKKPNVKGVEEYKYTPAEIIAFCKKRSKYEDVINELKFGKIDTVANML